MVSPLFEAEAMFHLQQPHMQHLRSKFNFVFSCAVVYFQCASTCTSNIFVCGEACVQINELCDSRRAAHAFCIHHLVRLHGDLYITIILIRVCVMFVDSIGVVSSEYSHSWIQSDFAVSVWVKPAPGCNGIILSKASDSGALVYYTVSMTGDTEGAPVTVSLSILNQNTMVGVPPVS